MDRVFNVLVGTELRFIFVTSMEQNSLNITLKLRSYFQGKTRRLF